MYAVKENILPTKFIYMYKANKKILLAILKTCSRYHSDDLHPKLMITTSSMSMTYCTCAMTSLKLLSQFVSHSVMPQNIFPR